MPHTVVEEVWRPDAGRRVGYLVAAVLNGVLLWIAHQLLDWQWPRFLTTDWNDVLPVVSLSVVAGIVANLVYVVNDSPPVKSAGEAATAAISFVVFLRLWQVFPFDFSTYDADWSWLIRLILVGGMVGTAIGAVVQLGRLVTDRGGRQGPAPG